MYRNKLNDKADLIWIKQCRPTAASNVSYDNGICIKIDAIAERASKRRRAALPVRVTYLSKRS